MAYFIVIFLGLIAVVLLLTPLVWQLSRENSHLSVCLNHAQQEVAETFRNAEYYRLACDNASDGIIVQDMQGRIIWCNPAYCRMHRTTADKIMGRNPLEFALPDDITLSSEEIEKSPFNIKENKLQLRRNQNADGELFWNQISVAFRKSADGRNNAVVVCRNVTEQVERENKLRDVRLQLEHEASHDGLTAVPNRAAFLKFMEETMADPDRFPVGLLHIDLDHFKMVNDTHGHQAGDAVLTQTAAVLRKTIRDTDMVARVGGDEFVVVCPNANNLAFLDVLGGDLLKALSEPFEWTNRTLSSSASIGAALSSGPTCTPEGLLVQADFALYESKRAGRNQVALYDKDLHTRHAFELRRADELADAISSGALDYYFQPTLCLGSRQVVGLETLVRWIHPEDGVIPPDEFLPMVKDLGLMGDLDLCSMTAALSEKRRLNLAGFTDIGIAFNASPELLAHPEFVNRLVWGVEAGGIERGQVTIEVLETTDFGEASETSSHAAIIRDLRHAGFQVHLDDFGIGFAGLAHLASLDVTGVKIDRGLISILLKDETSRKIVRKIVELSNDLGLTVIAEGVEDSDTANALQAMGCGYIQGYWISRPLPASDMMDWLGEHNKHRDALRA